MKIEIAQKDDLSEILELQKLCYLSEAEIYNDYSIPPLHQTLEEIQEEFKNSVFLKALLENKIMGSLRAFQKSGRCYVNRVIVSPKLSNKGTGTALMLTVESYFSNCNRFELFTGNKSEKNLYFYNKLGYTLFKKEPLNEKVSLVYLEKIIHRKH